MICIVYDHPNVTKIIHSTVVNTLCRFNEWKCILPGRCNTIL